LIHVWAKGLMMYEYTYRSRDIGRNVGFIESG